MSTAETMTVEPERDCGFPFAAVVGMEDVKLALLIGAVEPRLGGILLRGQKGSAKTTLARGLAELLPGDPRPPFVELPIGSTEDRVVGTLDLASVLHDGERRFHAGLLASADGGVLYVDEVNLLPDHLVDVLLDVAVSGTNRVERDGVSFEHSSRFFLIGSMNPEEGELRPQLLDRFGLAVDVVSPTEPDLRSEAVHRRIEFDADPDGALVRWAPATTALRARVARSSAGAVPPTLVDLAVRLSVELGADGLRADLALCRAAAALAGLESRDRASVDDIYRVAPLALGHRRRRGPFDSPGLSKAELDEAMERATASGVGNSSVPRGSSPAAHAGDEPQDGGGPGAGGDPPAHRELRAEAASDDLSGAGGVTTDEQVIGRREPAGRPGSRRDGEERRHNRSDGESGERGVAADDPAQASPDERPSADVLPIGLPPSRRAPAPPAEGFGRGKARHPSAQAKESTRGGGRIIGAHPAGARPSRLAVGPSSLAAAARRRHEGPGAAGIAPEDPHEPDTEQRSSHLVVLCVDASGSMGAEHRTAAARAAALGLLTDAYQRRDRVAVVTFGGGGARVALRPTASIDIARARLADLPTGGRAPLGEAILQGLAICEAPSAEGYLPVLVVITDGRATWAPPGLDPVTAATEAAGRVASSGVASVVVDVETAEVPLNLGRDLATAMGARHLRFAVAEGAAIERAVRLVLSKDG